MTFKLITLLIMFLAFIGSLAYFLINAFSFYDPTVNCYINVSSDISRGNRETILSALDKIRTGSIEDYQNVCAYVDQIVEAPCRYADSTSKYLQEYTVQGCYVKGSKIIYLKPDKNVNDEVIESRRQLIINLAKKSKDYWYNEAGY